MLLTISPAKTLDFENSPKPQDYSIPSFINNADYLSKKLQNYSPSKLKELLKISDALTDLNFERIQNWELPLSKETAKQALHVFKGEVYKGIDADTLNKSSIEYLNSNLLILSGLYGVLRPNDLMLPYRLEMGSKFRVTEKNKNLYKYWGDKLAEHFNKRLQEQNTDVLINLASNEYFKAVNTNKLQANIITPEFKDEKNGSYKMIGFFAKKARGLMVRFIAENNITNPEEIKAFNKERYYFNNSLSNEKKWVFTRDH